MSSKLIPILCRSTPKNPSNDYDCNFESDCTNWRVVARPGLTWARTQGLLAFQDSQYNPLLDHTDERVQSYYLLLKPTGDVSLGDVSIIEEFCEFYSVKIFGFRIMRRHNIERRT